MSANGQTDNAWVLSCLKGHAILTIKRVAMKALIRKIKSEVTILKCRYFDKFVFIHINKTGGSSIEKALKLRFEHKTAMEKIAEIGRNNWDKKFTFAVVRNPWDKVVSHYHYRLQTNKIDHGKSPIDFKSWVKYAYGDNDPRYYDIPKMFQPQTAWISDESGNILVNSVIRFENLSEEFAQIAKHLQLDVTLPHVKRSKRGNYRAYYDEATEQIVRDWFKQDIEIFGYDF